MKTTEDRFWEKVDIRSEDDCWIWTASRMTGGYGQFGPGAHRYSYQLHFGKIPDGKFICHHCDNPPCVNPKHLFVGTHKENMADMVSKGRQSRPHSCGPGESNGRAKLTRAQVDHIRATYSGAYGEQAQLAREYGVSGSTINHILHGLIWSQ